MTQHTYRSDLIAPDFPLISEDVGHTILVPTIPKEQEEAATPEIIYIHNMMPTKEGMVSVGFTKVVSLVVGDISFEDERIIYGNARTRLDLALTANGALYVLKPGASAWLNVPLSTDITGLLFTIGTVDGITYLYFQGIGCFLFDEGSDLLVPVVLTGIDINTVIGITASGGYLVAYTITNISWSSTITATDFVPSSITGAGGGSIAEIEGAIVFIVPNSLGLLVYSENNVVAATLTGNRQYPFKLRQVTNSKGTLNLDLVAYEANYTEHFAFSKAGLQAVNSKSAKNILPEATDFLAGKQLEDFNTVTKQFTITDLTATMLKKVKFVSSRYLVLSYGETEFTHALIYDVSLERLGKIKLTHVDVFEYSGQQQEIAKSNIAFLVTDGSVQLLDFSVAAVSEGVTILGRYQYLRNRFIQLEEVVISNVQQADTFTCSALISLNGNDITSIKEGYLAENGKKVRKYNFHFTAQNFLLAFIGKMDLNSLLLTFTTGGKY